MTRLATQAYVRFGAGQVAEVDSSLRMTGGTCLHCCVYPGTAPILVVRDAHVRVAIGVPDPGCVTADDVAVARKLAEAVAKYVTELERRAAVEREAGTPADDAAGQAA